ncbi:alpha/beta fold hydrolase [Kitasatospora sp. NPDC056138]|uniref:alpha/beta fold hydrolase n=1 Tax=Kitasatospora sp. NPDC056138 TaxID=3345724 RepID=UPI0035DE8203
MTDPYRSTHLVDGPAGRIAVVDHGGDGPDVLLLHGAGRTLLDWEALRPHLTGLRLVAMDLRGHGRSDPPPDGGYGWTGHLADVDAVVSALGLRRPWLVGHSLGGMVAVRRAATRAGCRGVVDLDGFGGGVPSLYPGLGAEEVTARRAEQLALYSGGAAAPIGVAECAAQARTRARLLGWDGGIEAAGALRALSEDGYARPAAAELGALMAPLEGWDMFAEVRGLNCPVLLVRGARPPELGHLPLRIRELTESLIRGITRELASVGGDGRGPVRVAELADAGHMLHLERPAAVGGLLRAFLGA